MTNMKTKTFTPQMTQFLELGAKNRKRLSILGNKISNFNTDDEYNHSYIYSVPGLGKTHTVNDAMSKNGINYVTISGNVSNCLLYLLVYLVADFTIFWLIEFLL